MLYTRQTKTAMKIAFEAHINQVDKGGTPYIYHPIHLAEQLDTEAEITAALLHDVVEDTDWTIDALRDAGISEEALEILALLTHPDSEAYMDYIRRVAEHPAARRIKLLDMAHNMELTRLDPENHAAALHFQEKYREPWAFLNAADKV